MAGFWPCLEAAVTSPGEYNHVVLFDKVEFWLFKFTTGVLSSVIQCDWTKLGSCQLLVDFISHKSDWVTLLDAACTNFSVTGVPGHSFLGQGAFGRVFRVRSSIPAVGGEDHGEDLAFLFLTRFLKYSMDQKGPH